MTEIRMEVPNLDEDGDEDMGGNTQFPWGFVLVVKEGWEDGTLDERLYGHFRSKCLCQLCREWTKENPSIKRKEKKKRDVYIDYPCDLLLCCSGSRTPPPPSRVTPVLGVPRRYAVGDRVWVQVRLDPKIGLKSFKMTDANLNKFKFDVEPFVGANVSVPWPAEIIEEVATKDFSTSTERSHILTCVPPLILSDTSSSRQEHKPSTIQLRAHQIIHQTRTSQGFPTHFYNIQSLGLSIDPPYTLTLPQHHITPYTQNFLLETVQKAIQRQSDVLEVRNQTFPDPLLLHHICTTIKTLEQVDDMDLQITFPSPDETDNLQQPSPYLFIKGQVIRVNDVVLVKKSESTPAYFVVISHLVKGDRIWGSEVSKRQDRKGNMIVDEDGVWYQRVWGRAVEVRAEWIQGRAWPFKEERVESQEPTESVDLID
ncbi:hypothetical protein HK097_001224 [Rhizophlyctis rosea]|uniref:Uncharacterized protein n=1 Tax=Rhizophlyctis rosea TaxID=64517 RepID=A0AAD5X0X5_9FUNG|nr:hypothetical protein HK097_001224 [Rhizophlyctis rosea]